MHGTSGSRVLLLLGVLLAVVVVSDTALAGAVPNAGAAAVVPSPAATGPSVKSSILLRTGQSVPGPLVLGSVSPDALTYDAANGHLYVADRAGLVWVLLPSTGKFVSHALILQGTPASIALDTGNNHLFVVDSTDDQVAVVNASTGALVTRVGVGPSPTFAVFDPANGLVYVSNSGSDNLTVINGSTDAVSGSIGVGSGPARMTLDSWNDRLFVADSAGCASGAKSCNLTVVAATNGSVVSTVTVGGNPSSLAFDNQTGDVFVGVASGAGNLAQGRVAVIGGNSSKSITSVSLGAASGDLPNDLAFDYRDSSLYVPEPSGEVGVLNATSHHLVANLSVPTASRVLYDPVDDRLEFITGGSVQEYVVSPFTSLGGQSFRVTPTTLFFNPTSRQLFSLDTASGTLDVYNSKFQTVASYPSPGSEFPPVIPQWSSNPNNGYTYLADGNGNIEVLSWPTPGISTISDPHDAIGVAFDSANGDLYVANFDGNLTVYHAATHKLVATIGLSNYTLGYAGAFSFGVAYDAFNGKVYATLGAGYSPSSCSGINWVVEVNPANNSVAQVSTNVDAFEFGGIAVAGSAGYLYVTDDDPGCGQSELEVFQTSNLSYVGSQFYSSSTLETSIAYDKANGDVYLLEGPTVYRLDGNDTGALSFTPGGDPAALTYDGALGEIAISDAQSGTIDLVTP